jgi:hypothetical protein
MLGGLTALLVLCVATCVLWVRSYSVIEGLIWRYSHLASAGCATGPGPLYLGWSTEQELPDSPRLEYVHIAVQYPLAEAAPPVFEFAGFGIHNSATMHTLRIPFWFTVTLILAMGAVIVRYGRKPLDGLCAKCGYDMRATPDRCPECGTIPARAKA